MPTTVKVNRREARLIMNSAITLCDYVLDVFEDKKMQQGYIYEIYN
ncbi:MULTISPECIES: hypothetical protein [Staphylococcaceae]|nr:MULTISPECIES: hypothetical protein [Staphylococcaceae]